MPDEVEPSAELTQALAEFARLQEQSSAAARRIVELADAALRRKASPPSAQPTLGGMPAADRRLFHGPQEGRVRAFVEIVGKLTQPFTIHDAMWVSRLTRRTADRFLNAASEMDLVERLKRGQYQVVRPKGGTRRTTAST